MLLLKFYKHLLLTLFEQGFGHIYIYIYMCHEIITKENCGANTEPLMAFSPEASQPHAVFTFTITMPDSFHHMFATRYWNVYLSDTINILYSC